LLQTDKSSHTYISTAVDDTTKSLETANFIFKAGDLLNIFTKVLWLFWLLIMLLIAWVVLMIITFAKNIQLIARHYF